MRRHLFARIPARCWQLASVQSPPKTSWHVSVISRHRLAVHSCVCVARVCFFIFFVVRPLRGYRNTIHIHRDPEYSNNDFIVVVAIVFPLISHLFFFLRNIFVVYCTNARFSSAAVQSYLPYPRAPSRTPCSDGHQGYFTPRDKRKWHAYTRLVIYTRPLRCEGRHDVVRKYYQAAYKRRSHGQTAVLYFLYCINIALDILYSSSFGIAVNCCKTKNITSGFRTIRGQRKQINGLELFLIVDYALYNTAYTI